MTPVALLILFSSYLMVGFGFFSILYSSLVVVLLSTVVYTLSKHKVIQVDNLVEEKVLSFEEESSDQSKNIAPTPLQENESATEAQEEVTMDGVANYSTTSQDILSESECQDKLWNSEDSEVGWLFQSDVDHSPDDYSDGSISDEDSLIEIALPSGQYVDQQQKDEPEYNCSLQQKKRELSAEALFSSQQSLMEFLAEFNDMIEEENLIEIDISMGSIKYSRFEIKA